MLFLLIITSVAVLVSFDWLVVFLTVVRTFLSFAYLIIFYCFVNIVVFLLLSFVSCGFFLLSLYIFDFG